MPAHSERAGHIAFPENYDMKVESSGWNGLLRNRITPSDVDHPAVGLCFDNNGSIIFCDFSLTCDNWDALGLRLKGQRWLYESLIHYTSHCAIVCKHSITPDQKKYIDSLRDVERFQVMVWDFGVVCTPVIHGQEEWQNFVTKWVNEANGPQRIRRTILGHSVGMRTPRPPLVAT